MEMGVACSESAPRCFIVDAAAGLDPVTTGEQGELVTGETESLSSSALVSEDI